MTAAVLVQPTSIHLQIIHDRCIAWEIYWHAWALGLLVAFCPWHCRPWDNHLSFISHLSLNVKLLYLWPCHSNFGGSGTGRQLLPSDFLHAWSISIQTLNDSWVIELWFEQKRLRPSDMLRCHHSSDFVSFYLKDSNHPCLLCFIVQTVWYGYV